jgi:asparagine synthase (glutamine-hydrolysing)
MPTRASSLRLAYELWTQYGSAHLAYRLGYEAVRRSGLLKLRFPARGWDVRPLASWCVAGVPTQPEAYRSLRERSSSRFFFAPGVLPALPRECALDGIAKAEAVIAGRPTYFGHRPMPLGFPFDWFLNPFTLERADADRHWCERDAFEPGQGDIRTLWEPARFGWVYALVRAYAATQDARYASGFWTLIESWLVTNPPNMGPHWQDGQECALRLMALCFGLQAFWKDASTSAERVARLALVIVLHADRIEKNLNFARTQVGNHAVSEAAALYTAGVLFPECVRAPDWRRKGLRVLDDEARRHNHEDGSYVQHSMNYHRLMLQDYLWALRLAELNGDHLREETVGKIDKAAHFLFLLQDPGSGRVPNYGPNDGSLLLPLNACDFLDYRPAIGAAHFQVHRRKLYEPGAWEEDLIWLFGPDVQAAGRALRGRTSQRLDDGGYYVLRGREAWGMARCHSFRNRPNQADLLHLDLWWRGLNVLRDSGSYLYNAPWPWRDWFTSTAAHNTIQLGGQDQMIKVHRFTWAYLARARVLRFQAAIAPNVDCFEGEHYGYQRLPSRATHRRAIARLGEALWLVIDDILGRGKEQVRLFWQFLDVPFTSDCQGLRLSTPEGPVSIAIHSPEGRGVLRVARGEEGDEPMGWESLHYGERRPAPTACFDLGQPELPQRIITLISLGGAVTSRFDSPITGLRLTDPGGSTWTIRLAPLGLKRGPVLVEIIGERAG